MIVRDLQTKKNFNFIVNKWFAVEEDDGLVSTINMLINNIPPAILDKSPTLNVKNNKNNTNTLDGQWIRIKYDMTVN